MVNYLRGSIRLLQSHHSPAEDLDGLEHALASAHRAGEIVRRLRDFVSRGVVNRRPERVVTLIDEAVALGLVDAASAGIRCRTQVAEGVEWVLVDRVQIQQVLINLLSNAVEALNGADHEREIIVTAAILNPSTVEIAVSDTGHGLSTEVKSTLFSSFQTTKPTGMGVGLSICRTIVEANGGTIVGENGPSGGAVFRFTLPISDGDLVRATEQSTGSQEAV